MLILLLAIVVQKNNLFGTSNSAGFNAIFVEGKRFPSFHLA